MDHPKRRRRMLVDLEVQRRMILSVSWPPAVFLMMTALALGYFTVRLHNEALQLDVELPSLTPVFWILGAFMVFAMGFVILNALRFSHRIAGPTYRLLRTMEAACEGDHAIRAKLREGDYLMDLADGLNLLLDKVERLAPSSEEPEELEPISEDEIEELEPIS